MDTATRIEYPKKRIIASGAFPPSSNLFWATWSILTACNYSCTYCPIRADEYADDETIASTIKLLEDISKKKTLEVTIFGGEPTLHEKLEYICEKLSAFSNVRIFTNLSQSADYYNMLAEKYSCRYSVSYHPDMLSGKDFLDTLKHIQKDSIGHINVMMATGYEKEWFCVSEYCIRNKIHHKIIPIYALGDKSKFIKSVQYSHRDDVIPFYDTQIVRGDHQVIKMTDQECELYDANKFKGYICYKRETSCFIDHAGHVYGCLQDVNHGICTNVHDPYTFSIEKQCQYDNCICENYIPKEIEIGFADKYLSII